MADIKSPAERSRNMSRIGSTNTKPEEFVRKELFRLGYRYRKNTTAIFGCPDIWLKKYNTAIFVHGCFWHRHASCKYAYSPKSNITFWDRKFQNNIERDRVVRTQLYEEGIKVLIIWECTVKSMKKSEQERKRKLSLVMDFMNNTQPFLEI